MGILRLLLAISVILFHANVRGFQFVGGGIAVEAFFIISGFYMSLVLDTKYTQQRGGYRLFITNRLLKLYPAYWTVLILAVAMQLLCWLWVSSPILVFYQIVHFNMQWPGALFLGFSNLFIVGQDMVSFFGLNKFTGELFFTTNFMKSYPFLFTFLVIPQGWSLAVELGFYLVAPLLVRRKWYVVVLLMAISLGLRYLLVHVWQLRYDPWVFRFLPSQLLLFLAGNIAYRVYKKRQEPFTGNRTLSLSMLAIVAIFTITYSTMPWFLVKKACYLMLVVVSLPFLLNSHRYFSFDTYLGELSYPVYLSHMLVLQTLSMLVSQLPALHGLPMTISTIVLSLLVSALINRYVIVPVNRIRQQRVKKNTAVANGKHA